MATYYVGSGGNDGNAGTSWGARKLTIQSAVTAASSAGDTVYVAPGTYRETVTFGSSGSGGSPISLIGDYTGVNTSGTRGVVWITGSNDDISGARANVLVASSKSYITISGFRLGGSTGSVVSLTSCTNITISKCFIDAPFASAQSNVNIAGSGQASTVVEQCYIRGGNSTCAAVNYTHTSAVDNTSHVVRNCIILGPYDGYGVQASKIGNISVANCLFMYSIYAIANVSAPTAGQTITVNNCILAHCRTGFWATATGEITEDYNTLMNVSTARTNTSTGANSVTRPPLFDARWFFELVNGGRVITPFDLSSYSTLVEYNSGTGAPSTDLRGAAQVGSYREWGPLEYNANLGIMSPMPVVGSPIIRGLGTV